MNIMLFLPRNGTRENGDSAEASHSFCSSDKCHMLQLICYSVLIFQRSHVSESQNTVEKQSGSWPPSPELRQTLVAALEFPELGVKIPHLSPAVI